jgi:hypothetical protein
MHLLFDILLIFLFIPSYSCQNNLTYVFSQLTIAEIELLLNSNGFILTNSSYVKRLSSSTVNFLNSTQILLSANDIQSIAVTWDTGDCTFPSALALQYPSINISSPICFTELNITATNLLQLTITSKQLAHAAYIFMNHYTLTYFSIIISDSSSFYTNLAQEFSTYLTEYSLILEQFLFKSSFTSSALSARSKG